MGIILDLLRNNGMSSVLKTHNIHFHDKIRKFPKSIPNYLVFRALGRIKTITKTRLFKYTENFITKMQIFR